MVSPHPVPPAEGATAESLAIRAGLAAWLGVLFCLLFTLNTAGGWVRLSGSGVAIPHWPVIEIGERWTLLPPFTASGWDEMHRAFIDHQQRLQQRIERGELSVANLGRQPRDQAEFRGMFLTEWSHRLLAAITGLVALACLITAWRRVAVRRLAAVPLSIAGALIVAQAVLGGVLVAEGTNTHWLFLHQGNAGAIMAMVLWALLRLVAGTHQPTTSPEPSPELQRRRRALIWISAVAVVATWGQLVFGALVAGSRHHLPGPVPLDWSVLPRLWEPQQTLAWNLLDNAWLHLFVHRWWAWALTAVLGVLYVLAARSTVVLGERQRLALQVSATFLAVQMVFGLVSAAVGMGPFLGLAHQALGMCLLLSLVLAWHDARYEPQAAVVPDGPPSQALVA